MFKVNSCQFNYMYNGRIHFPFSISLLVAYIKSKEHLNKFFKFEKSFIFRNKIHEYLKQCKDSDILLCSCYTWNWEITTHFAKEVKKLNPNCLIIFGGPQVPNRTESFFDRYPFVDILVHGEGEIIIENILASYLKDKNYLNVKGISTKDFRTDPQPRMNDLTDLPSPYLTNVIWDLTDVNESDKWAVSWETHRGCPYACTFCDWGSAVNTKTRQFSDERLFKEIEWFAKNKMTYIECCDANFGIFHEKHLSIAKKLNETASKTGYPKFFRSAWAKVSSERIIPIAKELQASGLMTSVTLALQSLDEETLDIIKRSNIKFERLSQLTEAFRKNEIPTYTELIRGLPGETLESFKKGLETIVSDPNIGTVYIYNCGIFVNAPMNEPSYREFYKIKTIRSPIFLAHSSINEKEITEYENLTVSTSTFTFDELKEMYYYSWVIMTLHGFGILDHILKYYNKIHGLPLMKFYETFLNFCRKKISIFSKEYNRLVKYVDDGYGGRGWNHYDPDLGEINWPIEEASWARLASDDKALLEGIGSFTSYLEKVYDFKTPSKILNDLAKFQVFLLSTKENNTNDIKTAEFKFDWKNFFVNNCELKSCYKKYCYRKLLTERDPIQWAYKVIWWGRSTKQFKFFAEHLQEENFVEELTPVMSKLKFNPSP